MSFKSGQSGNPGGRPKGSENIATSQVRKLWSEILLDNVGQLKMDFKSLKPKDRLIVAARISNFLLPRLQSIQIDSYPEWADLLLLTPEERASEIFRLKKQIEDESGGKDQGS